MFYELTKRIIDIIASILIGIVFLPICIVTAIAIKLETPGPIFADTPGRVGKNGKIFRLYKFRSMIVGAHQLLRTDPRFKELFETPSTPASDHFSPILI